MIDNFLMSLISGDIKLQKKYFPEDLDKVINYAKSTNSLTFMLNSVDEAELLHEKYQELIKLSNLHSTSRLLMQNKTLEDVNNAINDSFKVIILKGMQTKSLYRNKSERFCRDIDLLVEEENVIDFANILLQNGFEFINEVNIVSSFNKKFSHQLPPMRSKSTGLFIEIHHRVTKPSIFKDCLFTNRAFSDFDNLPFFEGTRIKAFDYDLLFIHCCYHLISHHFFSSGIFSLIDLKLLSEKINCERVTRFASEINLIKEVKIGINICKNNGYLKGKVHDCHLYDQINSLILHSFNDPEIFPTKDSFLGRANASASYNYVEHNFTSRFKFYLRRISLKFTQIFYLLANLKRVFQRLTLRKGLKNIHFE